MSQNTTAMQRGAGGETTGATDMTTQKPEALSLTEIARYCFRSEGMSDPPEQLESPTGDMVDYFDHVDIEKALLARIAELESQLAQRFDAADMATVAAQGFRDGAAKEQQAEWQPIETAPKDGSRILLHPAVEVADDWSKGHWNGEHECWIVGGSPSGVVHTAWHPLPPAPSTEGESND